MSLLNLRGLKQQPLTDWGMQCRSSTWSWYIITQITVILPTESQLRPWWENSKMNLSASIKQICHPGSVWYPRNKSKTFDKSLFSPVVESLTQSYACAGEPVFTSNFKRNVRLYKHLGERKVKYSKSSQKNLCTSKIQISTNNKTDTRLYLHVRLEIVGDAVMQCTSLFNKYKQKGQNNSIHVSSSLVKVSKHLHYSQT